MRDFTLQAFKSLCIEFQKRGYKFITFSDYCSNYIHTKFIIMRHDVDRKPESALKMAILENKLKIRASYYFRIVKESFNEFIIRKIAEMNHEIGYHYENLTTCGGNLQLAIDDFRLYLEKLRKFYPVKTICMHGSPLSRIDNRDLWKVYNYRNYGIIGEPYFDIDFNEVFYLTDTGRRWDGEDVAIRDKVKSKKNKGKSKWPSYHSTPDIIQAVEKGNFPDKAMIVIHPQRWTDEPIPWLKELIWQNSKNIGKKILVRLGG